MSLERGKRHSGVGFGTAGWSRGCLPARLRWGSWWNDRCGSWPAAAGGRVRGRLGPDGGCGTSRLAIRGFIGRDGLLAAVRERLLGGDKAVVQALHGMGGVGKT